MKYLIVLVITTLAFCQSEAQICSPVLDEVNQIKNDYRQSSTRALSNFNYDYKPINNLTGAFFDAETDSVLFTLPSIKGLWAGAYDRSGNLKVAASSYGNQESYDFIPGPIWEEYEDNSEFCEFFKRVWSIKADDLASHQFLFTSGALQVEDIATDILEWPAKGNPNIAIYNNEADLAPFFDHDSDGFYDPMKGDYPIALIENPDFTPSMFRFYVFNDLTQHLETESTPLVMEFHVIDYVIDCQQKSESETSIFTRLKYINKSQDDLREFRIGIWNDPGLGCLGSDLQGCSPALNSSYTYNRDGHEDGWDCSQILNDISVPNVYGAVRSIVFLNKSLEKFIFFFNSASTDGYFNQHHPQYAQGYYNFLNGIWLDNKPITIGNTGLNNESLDTTSYVFPDFPNKEDGWSMQTVDLYTPLGSISTFDVIESMSPNQVEVVDFVDHILISQEKTGLDIFDLYESAIMEVKDDFNDMKEGDFNCNIMSATYDIDNSIAFKVFPNPTMNILQLVFHESQKGGKIFIHSVEGEIIGSYNIHNHNNINLPVSDLAPGIYMLSLRSKNNQAYSERFVKM